MSEIVAHMERLDLRKSKNGHLYWVDAEHGTIPEEDALKSLSIDPNNRQEPVKAIWNRKDTGEKLGVTIVGHLARNMEKNEDLLQAEGMTVGIPRSELEWVANNVDQSSNGEKDRRVTELETQNRILQEQNRIMQDQLGVMRHERQQLEQQFNQRFDSLNDNLNSLQAKLTRYEEGVEGFRIGDQVGLQSENDEEYYDLDYIVIGYSDDGEKIKIKDLETDDIYEVKPDELAPEDEVEVDDGAQELEPGTPIGLQDENDDDLFERGYIYLGRADDGQVRIMNLQNRHITLVNADRIISEDELEEEDEPQAEFQEGTAVGRQVDNGYLIDYEIAEIDGPDENGNFRYRLRNQRTGQVEPEYYEAGQLMVRGEIPADQVVVDEIPPNEEPPARSGFRGRIDRYREGFGGWIMGRRVEVETGIYTLMTRGGGRRTISAQEYNEYREANRRTGTIAAIGAGALFLAGMATWWLIDQFEDKRGIPKVNIPRSIIERPIVHSPIYGHGWEVIPPKGSIPANETIHFYNGNHGNHAFAYAAPANYGWSGHAGDYSFTGPNGHTVNHLQWKDNGVTSDGSVIQTFNAETKHRLLRAFPELKIKLGQLFYRDNSGPGRHGWIKHYIPYLLPRR